MERKDFHYLGGSDKTFPFEPWWYYFIRLHCFFVDICRLIISVIVIDVEYWMVLYAAAKMVILVEEVVDRYCLIIRILCKEYDVL